MHIHKNKYIFTCLWVRKSIKIQPWTAMIRPSSKSDYQVPFGYAKAWFVSLCLAGILYFFPLFVHSLMLVFPNSTGYIGEFEYVDDHRSGKIVVELNGRLNKCGVISQTIDPSWSGCGLDHSRVCIQSGWV